MNKKDKEFNKGMGIGIIVGMSLLIVIFSIFIEGKDKIIQQIDTSKDFTKYYIKCDITGRFEYGNHTFYVRDDKDVNMTNCIIRQYVEMTN